MGMLPSNSADTVCKYCGKALEVVIVPPPVRGAKAHTFVKSCSCEGSIRAKEDQANLVKEKIASDCERDMVSKLIESGVPRRFAGVEPDHESLKDIHDDQGLYLLGPVGTFKSTTACAILKAFLMENPGKRVRFANVSRMFQDVRSSYEDSTEESEGQIMASLSKAHLVVLDDLGKGELSAWGLERLYVIVNNRYDEMLPTIVTTQYPMDELGRRLAANGDADTAVAIVSRLFHVCKVRTFDGPDRRMQR